MDLLSLIPDPCPWCGCPRKVSCQHESTCRSQDDSHEIPTEIVPRLWVGSVMSRPDPRFIAVVTILSPGEMHWAMGAKIADPPGAWHVINHGDHEPGLVAHGPGAWSFIDRRRDLGPVLVHCGAGASRSPTIVAGYLITRMGMTLPEAMGKLLVRPQVMHIWPGYLRELTERFGGGIRP